MNELIMSEHERAATEDIDQTWAKYAKTREPNLRETLILHYMPLVRRLVTRLGINPGPELDANDLISHGLVGLIEALERYDPARGVAFEAYAVARVRGAVIDALRVLDPLPRSLRRRATQIEATIERLQMGLGRSPSDEEMAEALEIDIAAYRRVFSQVHYATISLDNPIDLKGDGQSISLAESVEDATASDAAQHGIRLEVVKLPTAKHGFVLLPRRWVVGRSIAWMARFRRLVRRLRAPVRNVGRAAFRSLRDADDASFRHLHGAKYITGSRYKGASRSV